MNSSYLTRTTSADKKYLYKIEPQVGIGGKVVFILSYPPTQQEWMEKQVAHCEEIAIALKYSQISIIYLFSRISASYAELASRFDPVGKQSNAVLLETCLASDLVVCAWGPESGYMGRDEEVKALLRSSSIELNVIELGRDAKPISILNSNKNKEPTPWKT